MSKFTSDNKEVPARCWYYLLEFNDLDRWEILFLMFSKERLMDLTYDEFWKLFKVVVERDFEKRNDPFNGDRKITLDDKEVPDRCWQYLRSFHLYDTNDIMLNTVSLDRIQDLTFDEFWKYFEVVTKKELER